MTTDDINRSLDLTGIRDHIHQQAVLFGGPYNGDRAPLPTTSTCRPRYLCQPGRDGDQTVYHYRWAYSNVFVYADHCPNMVNHGPMPGSVEECVEPPQPAGWPLFAAAVSAVLGVVLITIGSIGGSVLAAILN